LLYLITFHTHFGAMSLQRELNRQGIKAKMMPVPRRLSASCGVCVEVELPSPELIRGAEDREKIYLHLNGEYQEIT